MYKRPRVLPIQKTNMPDLPMKPASTTTKTKKPSTKKTTTTAKRPVKKLPTKQPRDRLGRFASKFLKGTVKVVKGTVKTVKKFHRTVKRIHSSARQRANLELRECKIALIERERKAGLKRKAVRGKRRK